MRSFCGVPSAFFLKAQVVLSYFLVGGIVAGEKAIIEIEFVIDEVRCVGVVHDVVFEILLVFDDVLDHPAEEGDIRSRPQPGIDIRLG